MCTYEDLVDATLPHGLMPLVVPQLRTITLGGAVTGLGIESTSFRNGLPHESVLEMDVLTGAGEIVTVEAGRPTCSTRSPTPTARSATRPGCGSSSSRCRRTSRCATCRFDRPRRPRGRRRPTDRDRPASWDGQPGRRPRRRGVRARRGLPDAGHAGPTSSAGTAPATTPAQQIYYRSLQERHDRPARRCTTTSGAGTPTGSGARAPSGCRTRASGGSGRGAGGAATSTTGWSGSSTGSGYTARLDRRARRRPRARRPGRRGPGRPHRASSCAGSTTRSGCARCGCARCGCASRRARAAHGPGRRTRWHPARRTSTSASGAPVPIPHGQPDGDVNRADRGDGDRARRAQVAVLRRLLRRGRPSTRSTTRPTSTGSSASVDPDGRLTGLYEKAVRRR